MKKASVICLLLVCIFAFAGCGEEFLTSVVRDYAGDEAAESFREDLDRAMEEGGDAIDEEWDNAKEDYKESAKEELESEIEKNYQGEDKETAKKSADTVVDKGFEFVDDIIDSLSGELHSPVPEGCTFSGPAEDRGKNWYGYHDIAKNIKEGSTPVYAVSDGKVSVTQVHISHGGGNYLVSYGNKVELFCDDNSEDVTRVIYAHLYSFDNSLGINDKLLPMSGSIGGTSSKIKSQYGENSIKKEPIAKDVRVKKGQILGYVGNTGNSSGPHLHIEVYKGKTRVDPTDVFDGLV